MDAAGGETVPSKSKKRASLSGFLWILRKRRIIEALAAFIGGGWLLLEFVHWILVDHYHFPERTIDLTFIMLLGALASTLIWRWFSGREKPRKFKVEWILLPAVVLVTVVLGINQVLRFHESGAMGPGQQRESPPSASPVHTLAVLPFRDLASQPAVDAWGIGMTDAIINRLTSLSSLVVRPTSEVLKYVKSPADLIQAGRELQVDSVLDGTFQRVGDFIRVSVQLVDCSTRASRWAKNVDLRASDKLKFQDEMAQSVVESLSLQLTAPERADMAVPITNSPEAYDLFFEASSLPFIDEIAGSSQADVTHQRLDLFQQAVAKDPKFAQAYVGISACLSTLYFHEGPSDAKGTAEKLARAQEAAEHAVHLNARLAEAYLQLGTVFWFGAHFEESIRNLRIALSLAPNLADAWYVLGHQYHFCGLLEPAERAFRRAFELSPTTPLFVAWHAQILLYLGRPAEAEQELRRRVAAKPDDILNTSYLGQVLFYQGKVPEAEPLLVRTASQWWPQGAPYPLWFDVPEHLAYLYASQGQREKIDGRLFNLQPGKTFDGHAAFREAGLYALLGEKDISLKWLKRAVALGYWAYPWYERDMRFDKLRSDPEFQSLLAQVKDKTEYYKRALGEDGQR